MARNARRSVASNPSSQEYYNSNHQTNLLPLPYSSYNYKKRSHYYVRDYKDYSSGTPESYSLSGSPSSSTTNPNDNYLPINNILNYDDSFGESTTISPEVSKAHEEELRAAERARVKAEFYATYDVMTGVRIATTLGAFFSLMVFLIVWKSRSNSNETMKALKDPKIAAVAAQCYQEEEDRELAEAIEATGMTIFPEDLFFRRQRMLSLGEMSAPPDFHGSCRFSSVGGGSGYLGLLEPPSRRLSYAGRRSVSASSRVLSDYPMGNSFGTDDYFMETDDEMEDEIDVEHKRQEAFLIVPQRQESRRSSAMTCCSTESSYLERRGSAYTLGLGSVPPSLRRKLSSVSRTSSTENWDYYYPGIHVIKATPNSSPCTSEKFPIRHGSPVPVRQARLRKQSSIGKGFSNSSYDAEAGMCYVQVQSPPPPFVSTPKPSTSRNNGAIPKVPRPTVAPSTSYQQFQVNEKQTTATTPTTTTSSSNGSHRFSFRKKPTAQSQPQQQQPFGSLNSIIADDLPETVSSIPSVPIKRAPLASLSSFKISSLEYQDSENRSVEYDSLFMDSIPDDTDHDLDEFSTDSEEACGADGRNCRQYTTVIVNQADSSVAPVTTTTTITKPAADDIKISKKLDIGKCSSRLFGSSSFKLRSGSRRPTLERHKTISSAYSSSTDQILIVGKEEMLPMQTLSTTFIQGTTTATTTIITTTTPSTTTATTLPPQPQQQLLSSSRLGDNDIPATTIASATTNVSATSGGGGGNNNVTVIQMANLSPKLSLGAKRKSLKTQISDTPSIPTNTDDTTPETCSITLNTEIIQELPDVAHPLAPNVAKSTVVLSLRNKSCSCSDLSRGFCSCKDDEVGVVSEKTTYSKAIMIEMPVIKRQNTSDEEFEYADEDEEGVDVDRDDENDHDDNVHVDDPTKETFF